MGGYCSLVILCLGAVAALSAMALVAIAATTDHWVETRVDREAVKEAGKLDEHEIVFFSRHRGIFRVCFPGTDAGVSTNQMKKQVNNFKIQTFSSGERPDKHPDVFLSLVEDWCIARDYRFV